MPRFWQAEKIDFHFTDFRYLCFQFKRTNIADHSQWIMLIPDFVAFFFMSLSLFSVESLQHLILRSLNSWNFYLIIQQYTEVKFEKKKCFTDINSKYYLCLSWVSWIRWKIYVTGKKLQTNGTREPLLSMTIDQDFPEKKDHIATCFLSCPEEFNSGRPCT